MDKKENKLKLHHGQIIELIKSYQGKTLIGKLMKNRQDVRDAYIRKAKDLLLRMVEIDEKSPYVDDARQKLYGFLYKES